MRFFAQINSSTFTSDLEVSRNSNSQLLVKSDVVESYRRFFDLSASGGVKVRNQFFTATKTEQPP